MIKKKRTKLLDSDEYQRSTKKKIILLIFFLKRGSDRKRNSTSGRGRLPSTERHFEKEKKNDKIEINR